ncbi:hypothetical protein [Comamonas thiooxydans]|uniref:hypothetical protein n=1 Tax=Comamonas thiooxydans TaxID=363952 RepID=UPI0011868EEC|nr:hypothetical protein [Comamonas thiooxydans]
MNLMNLLTALNPWAKKIEPGLCVIGHAPGLLGRPVTLGQRDLNAHVLVSGDVSTKAGDLGLQLALQSIQAGNGLVMLTTSSRMDTVTQEVTTVADGVGRGPAVKIVDFSNPNASLRYNPLLAGSAEQLAQKLTCLLPALDSPGAALYRQECSQGAAVIFDLFKQTGTPCTLADLNWALAKPEVLLTLVGEMRADHPAKARLRSAVASLLAPDGSGYKIKALAGLRGRVQSFMMRLHGQGHFFGVQQPDVQIASAIEQNDIVIIGLPQACSGLLEEVSLMVTQDVLNGIEKNMYSGVLRQPMALVFHLVGHAPVSLVMADGSKPSQLRGAGVGVVAVVDTVQPWQETALGGKGQYVLPNIATRLLFKQEGTDSVWWANQYPTFSSADFQRLEGGEFYAIQHVNRPSGPLVTQTIQGRL